MKGFFSIFLTILFLLFFSCAGTPDSPPEKIDPEPEQSVETSVESENTEDEIIAEEPQDFFEIVELSPEEEEITDDTIGDDTEEIAEELAKDDTDYYIDDYAEDLEDIPVSFETADLNEQAADEQSADEQASFIETPADTTPQTAQTEPPVSVLPPAQPQTQTPAPPPEPVQPQAQMPAPPARQPPVPPPALLGPAEERPPSRVETVPPRRDIPAPVTGETPVSPGAAPQHDSIVFSRTVRATVGQIVEIPFMGTGWVYLGELASRRGLVYSSSRRDPEGQSFIFGVEEAGTYALKFFKEDFLRGYILNDYVQVIVGEAPAAGGTGWFAPPYDRGRVVAQPRWPSALDAQQREAEQSGSLPAQVQAEAAGSAGNTPPANISADEPYSSQGTAPSPGTTASRTPARETSPAVIAEPAAGAAAERREILEPGAILQKAGEAFEEGNAQAAIALLDQYAEYFPGGTDELYWMYGQFYEANTPSRNILLALDNYRRLVREYPQSSRCNDARRRIAYLERFYINIQ